MDKNNAKGFCKRVAAGFLIFAGAIIPGVSGGVIAVSLGLYERIVSSIYDLIHNFKRSFTFLLPLGLGGVVGTLATASAVTYLMAHFQTPVLLLFMGLVIGGMPGIVREGNLGGFRPKYLWAALIGAAFFTGLALGDIALGLTAISGTDLNFIESILTGVIAALGTIIPGVSTSFLLMLLNWYEPFMTAIADLNLHILLPASIGFAVTGVALLRLVNYVFSHARSYGYYAVAGFTSGSAVFLLIQVVRTGFLWWHILFFLLGLAGGIFFFAGKKKDSSKF
ncbi:MAG: DUF368 domain-containing protein [Clostridiaceae bacterium]|nr:DUF368 domain-containing protein [Clostridiaceae bacterium]